MRSCKDNFCLRKSLVVPPALTAPRSHALRLTSVRPTVPPTPTGPREASGKTVEEVKVIFLLLRLSAPLPQRSHLCDGGMD